MSGEKPADAWGRPISEERQRELQAILDEWEAEAVHGEYRGPFDWRGRTGIYELTRYRLTGADVSWLESQLGGMHTLESTLHLEGANLSEAHLEEALLRGAHLEGCILYHAHLEGANLERATLDENTILEGARLGPGVVGDLLDRLHFSNRNAALGDIK